ncbi:MAG: hypothetical protein GXO74_15680 [Calditrichaeota bacterium]|nr:hypothetical protein [Calditrichota bacterium]
MDVILSVGRTLEEKLAFLACYYSLQMLHLNIRSIDVLRLQLAETSTLEQRIPIFKDFMINSGKDFRKLTAAYMQRLLGLMSKIQDLPDFVVLGVGSLAHQDDIDLGVIDDGSPKRKSLNLVMHQLSQEMFRRATELHFYLTEHVGVEFYTASIEEFNGLLDAEIQDFIIITEMLNAVPIFGSKRLFKQFLQEIIFRYYYQKRRDNRYHEAYLRGILGEIRSFLFRNINQDKLNPKDDALRMLQGLIFSGKTIFRIHRENRWEILADLKRKDQKRSAFYSDLEKALSFLEVFRHVFQLYVGLEDDIYLDDPAMQDNLQLVAQTLGYHDIGAIRAWDHLLIHYHEYAELAKRITAQLLEDVHVHIQNISSFSVIASQAKEAEPYRSYPGNLAIDFLRQSRFFKGAKYWDDVLKYIYDEDSHLLENFIRDIRSLKPHFRNVVIKKYGQAFRQALYPSISFLTLLAQRKHQLHCPEISGAFIESFLEMLTTCSDRVLRLTKVFSWYPKLLNDFFMILSDNQRKRFSRLIEQDLWEPHTQRNKELLVHLCEIHSNSSHYFKRFFTRIVTKHPSYIAYLKDLSALDHIAQGMLGTIDSLTTFEECKNQLNDFHDLEFLRLGLEALKGSPIEMLDSEFTLFTDNYLKLLFDISKQEVNRKIGGYFSTRDLIAICAAGGHGREQAFDDDYDLIFLLDEDDEEIRRYCNKIVSMMNCEIMRRGTMPHYRFADHFGRYITLVDDLDEFFSANHETDFIDKSQILSARMIVGTNKFQRKFIERIVRPHIFEQSDIYIKKLIQEMSSRHKDKRNTQKQNIIIKEGIGGLRDIEFLLLIYKAKYQLNEPLNMKLIQKILTIDTERKTDLLNLIQYRNFLKQVRDLYRLTVSASDILKIEYLRPIAKIMGYQQEGNSVDTEKLVADIKKTMEQVHVTIDKLISKFS